MLRKYKFALIVVAGLVVAFYLMRHRDVFAKIGAATLGGVVSGGAKERKKMRSEPRATHVVVDTLNLTHHMQKQKSKTAKTKVDTSSIIGTIDRTAKRLRELFEGRVMYVLKDRDAALLSAGVREQYAECAKRNGVYVASVERYADPPVLHTDSVASDSHAAKGRDDFYMAVLAARWQCPVLTEDRLRDFAEFRKIEPFHVVEFSYWSDKPESDYIIPSSASYSGLRKPRTIRYASLGL